MARAEAKAAEHGDPVATTVEALLANPDIEFITNLTISRYHPTSERLFDHVTEAINGFQRASDAGRHDEIRGTVEQPLALLLGLPKDALNP